MAKNKVEKTASASKKPAVSKVPKSKTKVNKKAGLEDKVQSYLYDKNTDVKDISKESEQFIEKPEVLQVTESKGNKKSKKSKKVSTSSIKARIGKFFLKLFFIYIPVFVISLVVLVLIVLKLVLSPGLVEKLAMDNFNKLSNGSLSLDVKEFSPYSGFVIEKIVLKNSKEFDNSDFVVIDKLVFKYGFFSIFTGNIHIDEIGIYKPRIALKQSSGKWNFETLMKPTAKEPEEEIVEEPKKEGEPLKEINLPISVQFLFKFVLSELSVTVDADTFKTELRDFTFLTDIYIPPFKRVPLSLEAAKLLQTCDIRINPAEKLNLYFNSKEAEVTPPLILGLDVLFNNALPNQPRFNSSLRIGTYNTPIRFNQAHLAPLNFLVYYDLFYEPVDDTLKIDSFGISFNGDKLLNIAGTVSSVTTKQEIDIKMTESKINLSSLYPYFKAVTGNNDLKFSGIISLMPLTIKGDPKKLDVNGALNMNSIYVNVPGFVLNMPKFVFDYTVLLRDDNAIVSTELQMPDFHYVLNKEKSGLNSFYLGLKASTAEQFKKFNISDFNIRLMDSVSKINALTMSLNGDVSMIDGTSGKITIPAIVLRLKPLGNTLPKSIRDSLAGIPINKPVTLNLATVFSMTEAAIKAELGLGVVVPDYNVTDLNIGLSMIMDQKSKVINLKYADVTSVKQGLNLHTFGWIDISKSPIADSDLNLSLKFNQNEMKNIYGPWGLSGSANITANFKGDDKTGKAKGKIDIDKLFVKNDQDKMYVDDFNFHFPFEYSLKSEYKGKSKIAKDKSQFISNENFKEKENFTIKSIRAMHPARNEALEYMKDFSATMYFRDNAFEIVKMKATIFDGTFFMRDTFFYLADMDKTKMEYKLQFDITNIDIGKMDQEKKIARDAELSMKADISGKSVDFAKEFSMSGSVNIYKIGNKFANKLMKGLSGKKGESKLGTPVQFVVDNAMLVKNLDYYVDNGNVYTTIKFQKKVLGYAVSIQDDKVEFERIPVQEYIASMMSKEE